MNKEDIYTNIIFPNTRELLDITYNIIYFLRKILVKKNICNNKYITIIYKIIQNYLNKIDNELSYLSKLNNELYKKYKYIYENAILFLKTIKLILIELDKDNFYNDLYDVYSYYYNIVINDLDSDIYKTNYKLLELFYNHLNNSINKELLNKLDKLEIDSFYYDIVYSKINNISINAKKILKDLNLRDDLIKSNITLQQSKNYNEEEIIKKKKNKLDKRKRKTNECNLLLTLEIPPNIKKEKKNLKDIVFTTNSTDINELIAELNINQENNENNENNEDNEEENNEEDNDIKNFKENLKNTIEKNNNNFDNNKELKNNFNKYFDNGKNNTINNYNNNSIASLFSHYLSNNKTFILCDNDRYTVINYNNKERDCGTDFGNIRKKFIQSLIDELFEKKIFINDEREKNNKYFLNSNYNPDEPFMDILKNNNKSFYDLFKRDDKEFIKEFYKFIAYLITFLLFSDYNIMKEFSSYLLSNFYKIDEKSYTDYDYIYYLFKDFDNYTKKEILKILDIDSEELLSLEFNYNNEYLLDNNEDIITSSNVIHYITNLAKFLELKTIEKTKDDKIIARGELINKTFTSSIPSDIKKELNTIENINNSLISNLFRGNEITITEMKELFFNNIIFSIIKMRDENINYKILVQKKILIFALVIKLFFINHLFELFKSKNNYKCIFTLNNKLSIEKEGKYYPKINEIQIPDYFFKNNDEEINQILKDFSNPNEENLNEIQEKYKDYNMFNKLNNFFKSINQIVGGRGRKNEYELYIENNCYFIYYNNKKYYLTINNIIIKNNNLYIKIDKKYIKITF